MMMLAIAFALGFVGYLPLGNINMTVVQLALSQPKHHWQRFVFFAAFMEFMYCFLCLMGLDLLLQQTQVVEVLSWAGVVIFFLLGIFSFIPHKENAENKTSDMKRGVLIAIFNPLQVPFWLVWGVYVMQNKILKPETFWIFVFSLVCTIGTLCILYLYAVAGKKIIEKLRVNRTFLNRFIGTLLIVLAIFETVKLLKH